MLDVTKLLPADPAELQEFTALVIDTKFNAIVMNGWYLEKSLRSGYLYQMYAYLRSQKGSGDGYSDDAEGLLLHSAVGSSFDESVVIQGHKIRFMTVDLTASSSGIRADLLRLVVRTEVKQHQV